MDGEFEKLNKFDCKHLKTEPGAGEIVDTTSQVIGENSDHTTATTKNKTPNTLKKQKNSIVEWKKMEHLSTNAMKNLLLSRSVKLLLKAVQIKS